MNPLIYSFLVPFVVSLVLIPILVAVCNKLKLFDQPNQRKVHKHSIPRLGGTVFMPAMLLGMITGLSFEVGFNETVALQPSTLFMILGAIMIYAIGILDDLHGLGAKLKFVVQFVAALILPLCNLYIDDMHGLLFMHQLPTWASYLITVFVIILVVNAINLIDGIDGLASSLSILILLAFAYLFYQLEATMFVLLALSLAGSVVAFFIYNVFGHLGKNKIFMGDTGSLFLGYVIAYMAVKYQMSNGLFPYRESSLLISYTLLIVPTFDLTRVAFARLLKHRSIFDADKTHIHHRIMDMGVSMHVALVIILLLFVVFCGLNYLLYQNGIQFTLILIADIALYSLFIFMTGKLRRG